MHGCFWHRHGCKKTYVPKSRREFWQAKFARNVERDRRDHKLLARKGWRVFVAWECEVETDSALLERLTTFLGPPRTLNHG
jgi:DNA mismatch endonuclease (patch repair protein)